MTTPTPGDLSARHVEVLRQVVDAFKEMHSPFNHDYVKDEKCCARCKLLKKADDAIAALPALPAGGEGDDPIDANDNADYIEHCAAKLTRLGYRITGQALSCIAAEHRQLATTPPADADVGAQGEDEAAKRYIRDWCPDHVKDYIDRLATPAAGKGVDANAALCAERHGDVAALTRQPVAGDGWNARWQMEGDDSLILLTHPAIGAVGVWKEPREGRPMLEELLYAFGKHLIDTTGPAQGDGEVAS